MKSLTKNTVVIALASLTSSALAQTTFVFNPSQDTTIFADSTNNSSGAGPSAFVGNTAGGQPRRALVQFDLSSIPTDSIVTNASFSLLVDRAVEGVSATGLHRILASWGEGASNGGGSGNGTQAQANDATWIYRFFNDDTQRWGAVGGDFVATASATQTLGNPNLYTWNATPQMLADVQSWITSPSANYGWMLIGDEAETRTAKRFFTSEEVTASLRPTLALEVVPIPEPSTYGMIAAGLVMVGMAFRTQQRRARAAIK